MGVRSHGDTQPSVRASCFSFATPAEEHPVAPHPARPVAVGEALHTERLGVVGAGGWDSHVPSP
ncbi:MULTISPECIES: hypothetical protein [unclassified Pseudoalteromonas]|uniref:hypothetical protein n=1 Tax=unclassified Pseudoalteromonas TaxID=194690 RepID=UPI0018CD6FE7|nr:MULTISPECIES: hypothetical protein [unclassified Pseudoalteromonas]MBG9993362.1 hypothetical protein [Pseudoalteromonas sp. NZS37]MBH0013686.1 hypothetical protein [Pseudoalteromonas sp. NZS100_1]MBH0033032.1 hypothetical protein [Pseudoalteromonas sp. SWYJZ98]MBH0040690.1 hypothetical protein [Pseudoalteromonas sp. SWN166]MBH0052207.1 hypothetical protein [Pseudoalteromonas sp. SWYJZ19]